MSANGSQLHLRIALDYSARDAIARAAADCHLGRAARDDFAARFAESADGGLDVDLLIRTGGEKRLSDFLLWECAYAELHFTDVMWPDFSAGDLDRALLDFRRRERRFGGLPAGNEIALVAAE
jgi:undecaprenyl diphosphate synthase